MKLSFDVEEALSQCKTLEDISGKNGLLKRMLNGRTGIKSVQGSKQRTLN